MAEIIEIIEAKVKVKFNQDDVPSALEYPKLISYSPKVGDKVLMLKTNTSYICLGGIGAEAEGQKEDTNIVGEYKFFAKDKGSLWQGWARCDGRELDKNTYPELFAEIGTTFGVGNGGSTFNLPDATGRVLSDANGKVIGEKGGADTIALTINQMPKHSHEIKIGTAAFTGSAYNTRYALASNTNPASNWADVNAEVGSGSAHENRQPTLYGGYYYIYTGVM